MVSDCMLGTFESEEASRALDRGTALLYVQDPFAGLERMQQPTVRYASCRCYSMLEK